MAAKVRTRAGFPGVDRAGWFTVGEAKKKINPAQAALADELVSTLTS